MFSFKNELFHPSPFCEKVWFSVLLAIWKGLANSLIVTWNTSVYTSNVPSLATFSEMHKMPSCSQCVGVRITLQEQYSINYTFRFIIYKTILSKWDTPKIRFHLLLRKTGVQDFYWGIAGDLQIAPFMKPGMRRSRDCADIFTVFSGFVSSHLCQKVTKRKSCAVVAVFTELPRWPH